MNARLSLDEMRDALIAEKTAEHIVSIRAKVEAGEPPTDLIADGVTDLLSDSELAQGFAYASLIFPALAGAAIALLTEHVIADQAEVEATLEVERMERWRQESVDEARFERAKWNSDMATFGWAGMA
jgi:hypothetical protein